jgi:hypothetical protein
MRSLAVLVAVVLLAGIAATAGAALAPPPIPEGIPFNTARAELAKAGFVPARIVSSHSERCGTGCQSRPAACYYSAGYCRWLFVDRSNNALYFVDVSEEYRRDGSALPRSYGGISFADRAGLEVLNVEIVLPNGAHRRFAPPEPKPTPEPPTPLCSQVPPHTLPCWVKPPAGYRASH